MAGKSHFNATPRTLATWLQHDKERRGFLKALNEKKQDEELMIVTPALRYHLFLLNYEWIATSRSHLSAPRSLDAFIWLVTYSNDSRE